MEAKRIRGKGSGMILAIAPHATTWLQVATATIEEIFAPCTTRVSLLYLLKDPDTLTALTCLDGAVTRLNDAVKAKKLTLEQRGAAANVLNEQMIASLSLLFDALRATTETVERTLGIASSSRISPMRSTNKLQVPVEHEDFHRSLEGGRQLFNIVDIGIVAMYTNGRCEILSLRMTLGYSKTLERDAIFRDRGWIAARVQRDVATFDELLRRTYTGQALGIDGIPVPFHFRSAPTAWISNGMRYTTYECLWGTPALRHHCAGTDGPLFGTDSEYLTWINSINTNDHFYDLNDLIHRIQLRQPCGQHSHVRQFHIEMEYPIYIKSHIIADQGTRVTFHSPLSSTLWRVKWKSGTESGKAALEEHDGTMNLLLPGKHETLEFTVIFGEVLVGVGKSTATVLESSSNISSLPSKAESIKPLPPVHDTRIEKMAKPSLFIGSTVECLQVARDVAAELEHELEATVWNQNMFGGGEMTWSSLVGRASSFDFALLIFGADDYVKSRGKGARVVRDNVLIEYGLFVGTLGPERTFFLYNRDKKPKIASDLAGVVPLTYGERTDGNSQAAVGTACNTIRKKAVALGKRGTNARNP
jgi:predicted nucleotide-binding protein